MTRGENRAKSPHPGKEKVKALLADGILGGLIIHLIIPSIIMALSG